MEEPDEDDPGRRKSNPEQIIKAQRKASKVFKKINIKEDSFQQVDKERQALMQSLNKKGTDHVIILLTNKISQLGYQTEYLFCFITTFFNGHCSDIRISVTKKNNSYFYIEKWTFKIMCEVCYRAKRDKKEAT